MFGVKDRYQKKTMASAPKSLDNPEADLRKVGYLKKLKVRLVDSCRKWSHWVYIYI